MSEVIADDEVIYRRIPRAQMPDGVISLAAMRPHRENDRDGLSVSRALFDTPEALVNRSVKKDAAVFAATAGAIRNLGLTLVASPLPPDQPGHCHIPELNSSTRNDPECLSRCEALIQLFQQQMIRAPG